MQHTHRWCFIRRRGDRSKRNAVQHGIWGDWIKELGPREGDWVKMHGARQWPTFGVKLTEPDRRVLKPADRNPINNPISFLKSVIGTMMDAHDNYHISKSKGDFDRTVGVPTVVTIRGIEKEIKTVDFGILLEESQALYDNGVNAATKFLETWDFAKWKETYRKK